MRTKGNRIYPYNNGLLLGTELDIVLANENSEPVDAAKLITNTITVEHSGGDEWGDDEGCNIIKARNGMARLYSRQSYCRAYATDNIWWMMKTLVAHLQKRAFLSFVPVIHGEDFEDMPDDESYIAAGHMTASVRYEDIYSSGENKKLHDMTYKPESEAHQRLKDNIRLTVGLISLLLDRREAAEYRRLGAYGPLGTKEFRSSDIALVYQTPTNWWAFSPILAHLMLGAMRMAYFITLNEIEPEIWEGFEPGDVKHAIHKSSYECGKEIWNIASSRLSDSGYKQADNPFWQQRVKLIDFLIEYGVGAIGDGVYKNWHMARKMGNFQGHFADLPSWEGGALSRVFTESHPRRKELAPFLGEENV